MRRLPEKWPHQDGFASQRFPSLISEEIRRLSLICTFLFLIGNSLLAQNASVSNYSWLEGLNLDRISNIDAFDLLISSEEISNRLILGVETNPEGEVFVLTFGNGIKKVGSDGALQDFISGSYFTSPLDFAMDSEGRFFVPDNAPNERRINVFSPTGAFLESLTLGDGSYGTGVEQFRGPIGVALDAQDNLYVADHYTGDTEVEDPSRVKIFYKINGSYENDSFVEFTEVDGIKLNFPYRIAVDSDGTIYIADLGTGEGRVLVVEMDGRIPQLIDILEGENDHLGSPGDMVIDNFDNVYIADLGNELDLTVFLNAADDPEGLFEAFDVIKEGIRDEIFRINVYNSQRQYQGFLLEEIDLPLDMAINSCGTLYVDNFILSGNRGTPPFYPDMDITLDFDLEKYEFSAGPYKESVGPEITSCDASTVTVNLPPGETSFTMYDFSEKIVAVDNCDDNLEIIQEPAVGTSVTSSTTVSLRARDTAGNLSSTCTFELVIQPDESDPLFECDIPENPVLELDTDCNYTIGNYESVVINPRNFQKDPFIEQVTEEYNGAVQVTLNVYDGEGGSLVGTCEFQVALIDLTPPEVRNCTSEAVNVNLATDEKYEIPDFAGRIEVLDNCDSDVTIIQEPAPGTFIDSSTLVSLKARDQAGNFSEACSFEIIIEPDQPEPTFDCDIPEDPVLELDSNCDYTLSSYQSVVVNPMNFKNELFVEQVNQEMNGYIEITLNVYDGQGGSFVGACVFQVTLVDRSSPELLSCDADPIHVSLESDEKYEVPDFTHRIEVRDNCDGSVEIVQEPAPGSLISSSTTVSLRGRDQTGNLSQTCSFEIVVDQDQSTPSFNCKIPEDLILELGDNCEYQRENYQDVVVNPLNFQNEIHVEQEFHESNNVVEVILNVYDGQGGAFVGSCNFELALVDVEPPQVQKCHIDPFSAVIAPGETFEVPDFSFRVEAMDNCSSRLDIVQEPAVGTFVSSSTPVTLKVRDEAGNLSEACSFELILEETSHVPSFECNIPENPTLKLNASCEYSLGSYASVVVNPEDFENEMYVDQISQQIDGALEITLNVYDGQGGVFVGACEFQVGLLDTSPPEVQTCETSTVSVSLASGEKYQMPDFTDRLEARDNCSGSMEIIQEPEAGSFIDSNTTVSLKARDSSGNWSDACRFEIVIKREDQYTPIVCADKIVLDLNANGEVTLDPRQVFSGGSGSTQFTLDKDDFDCQDIGEQRITFSYVTPREEGSCDILVEVKDPLGACIEEPVSDGPFVVLFPNPGEGMVQILASPDIALRKVEVFDIRGRFLFSKTLEKESFTQNKYYIDLRGFQSGVYTLRLISDKKEYLRRAIISDL